MDAILSAEGEDAKEPLHVVLGAVHQGHNTNIRFEFRGENLNHVYEGTSHFNLFFCETLFEHMRNICCKILIKYFTLLN